MFAVIYCVWRHRKKHWRMMPYQTNAQNKVVWWCKVCKCQRLLGDQVFTASTQSDDVQ